MTKTRYDPTRGRRSAPQRGSSPRNPPCADATREPDPAGVAALPRPSLGSELRLVPFSDVLAHAERRWNEYAAADRFGLQRKTRMLGYLKNLRPFWERFRLGDVPRRDDEETIDGYVAFRTAQRVKSASGGPGAPRRVSAATAKSELSWLRSEVNEYQAEHGLVGKLDWGLGSNAHAPVEWLERDEVARLLWAVRGRQWDRSTGGWKVDAEGRRVIQTRMLRDVPRRRWDADAERWVAGEEGRATAINPWDWIARLIILLVYSGSKATCARRLRWSGTPDGVSSYVDLDSEIEGRTGHLYRLGPDLASRGMAGLPVTMCRRLAGHMRRWRERDEDGRFAHVLHHSPHNPMGQRGPEEVHQFDPIPLATVWERAGIDGSRKMSVLSCTAVVWVLRSGSRTTGDKLEPFKPSPAIRRSAAFMIGKDYGLFVERFDSVSPDFLKAQIEALESPAETVK